MGGTPFVGRGEEIEFVRERLVDAAVAEPTVLLISGDPGIGKTALASEIATEGIQRGFYAAAGHATESTADVRMAPVRGLLRELARANRFRTTVEETRLCAGLDVDAVGSQDSGGPRRLDDLDTFELILDALVMLSSDTPLVLTFEDLHWADRSSVELVHHLARNLRDARIVVVATFRTDRDELVGPHRSPIVEMERLAGVHRRHLTRFTGAEVRSLARLVTRRHLSEQDIARLVEAGGGNPLLTTELLRVGPDDWDHMTGAVTDIVRAALDRLPAEAAATVLIASMAPLAVDTALVAVANQPFDRVEADVRAAMAAGVLELANGVVRFRHALFASVAQRDALPSQLARLHGAFADVLADRDDVEAGHLAHLLELAGRLSQSLTVSIASARSTAGAFGSVEAVPHYERALRLWDAVDVESRPSGMEKLDLAIEGLECAFYVGDTAAARRCARAALDNCDPHGDHDAWVTLMCRASELAWQDGDTAESLELLGAAEEALGPTTSPGARAHVVERRSFHASMAGDGNRALDLASTAFDLAREAGDLELEIEAQLRVGLAESMAREFEDGLATLSDARRRAAEAGHHRSVIRGTINLTALHLAAGELAVARDEAESGAALAQQLDAPLSWQTHAVAWHIVVLVSAGDLVAATQLLNQSLSPPAAAFSAVLDVAGAELAWTAGDLAEARYLIERVSLQPQDHLGWWLRAELIRRAVAVAEGDDTAASSEVDFTLDLAEFWPDSLFLRLCVTAIDATPAHEVERLDALLARANARADMLRRQGRPVDTNAWCHLVGARHVAKVGQPCGQRFLDAADAFAACGRPIDEGWALVAASRDGVDGLTGGDVAARVAEHLRRPPSILAEAIAGLVAGGAEPAPRVAGGESVLAFGDFEVDPGRFELRRGNRPVPVEPQVLELIIFLARRPQELLTKERLLDEIWGDRFVSESALTTRVKSARQALGDDGTRQAVIKTVHRRGYRFVAELRA